MLECNDLACERNERLLFQHLNFTVSPGQCLYIKGANGAGKSSLLKILAGLLPPCAGTVKWHAERLNRCQEAYHGAMNYVGHSIGVKSLLTPRENLRFNLFCAESLLPETCEMALGQMGLSNCIDEPCSSLSAGLNQRVALARLLALERTLWLLDEPYTALDSDAITMLNQVIENHTAAGGMVVMSSHQEPALHSLESLAL